MPKYRKRHQRIRFKNTHWTAFAIREATLVGKRLAEFFEQAEIAKWNGAILVVDTSKYKIPMLFTKDMSEAIPTTPEEIKRMGG